MQKFLDFEIWARCVINVQAQNKQFERTGFLNLDCNNKNIFQR